MSATKRTTIYFDSRLHRALRLKSAETARTLSDIVNDAVRSAFVEDADDLAAIEDRASEPTRPFEPRLKADPAKAKAAAQKPSRPLR
jgi:hypothetical protein